MVQHHQVSQLSKKFTQYQKFLALALAGFYLAVNIVSLQARPSSPVPDYLRPAEKSSTLAFRGVAIPSLGRPQPLVLMLVLLELLRDGLDEQPAVHCQEDAHAAEKTQ